MRALTLFGHAQLNPGAAAPSASSLLAWAATLTFCNGVAGKAIVAINRVGFAPALANSFDMNILVLAAGVVGLRLAWSAEASRPSSRLDYVVAGAAAALALMPYAPMAWLGLSIVALRAMAREKQCDLLRRAGWILAAVSGSLIWTKLLFALFAPTILSGDALLTAALLNVERSGNMVAFADGSGFFQVYPACSSLGNVSVGIVCWVTAVNLHAPGRASWNIVVGVGVAAAVVTINIIRLALIGLYPAQFETIHGAVGEMVTIWTTLAAVVGLSAITLRKRAALV
ncbi:hypothetical protein GCM10007036_18530 [Alsobacter metallidurans]|uniref:Exosortase/archaeosortase family protein n=1 Tax=Alsobacter metallidurans TaxID=340221 RepID=A0A917I5P2_9HYPH|nr:hypothetical protein [Alsobacter metallidurans]GGH17244.1 hypothetical protein GCM10007036_18530 [Alsobacter metallidurans]